MGGGLLQTGFETSILLHVHLISLPIGPLRLSVKLIDVITALPHQDCKGLRRVQYLAENPSGWKMAQDTEDLRHMLQQRQRLLAVLISTSRSC